MFERNRVDQRSQFNTVDRPVQITMKNGEEIRARMVMRETRRLADEINEGGGFVELYPYGGDPLMLSKSAVQSIQETNAPRAEQLSNHEYMQSSFDPYEMLGIPQSAEIAVVRKAYHEKAKIYHPDRFAAMDVPDEILEYVCAVSRRLNVAYSELVPKGAENQAPADAAVAPSGAQADRPPVFQQEQITPEQHASSFRPVGPRRSHPQVG